MKFVHAEIIDARLQGPTDIDLKVKVQTIMTINPTKSMHPKANQMIKDTATNNGITILKSFILATKKTIKPIDCQSKRDLLGNNLIKYKEEEEIMGSFTIILNIKMHTKITHTT